jgi:hypothetical protein
MDSKEFLDDPMKTQNEAVAVRNGRVAISRARSLLSNASALVAAEAVALATAALIAFSLGIMTSPKLTGSAYVTFGTDLPVRWPVFGIAVVTAGTWLHLHGHYSDRIPLWTELRDLDSWYVRNWSFGYDLLIMLLTIPVLISRRGAY